MLTTDIDAIRARAAAATPGPWGLEGGGEEGPLFLAHARADVDALLAVVDHLRDKHAEAQALAMRRGEENMRLRGELRTTR